MSRRSLPAGRAAGLWPRVGAFALDYLPIAAYLLLLTALSQGLGAIWPGLLPALFQDPVVGQLLGFLLVTLPVSLYFALQEAVPRQATWGKARMGLRVVGPQGERLSLGRSLARTALKFVPWELAHTYVWQLTFAPTASPLVVAGLILVWVLVGANAVSIWRRADHRALYDLLAGTAVIHR